MTGNRVAAGLILAAGGLAWACAVNPATGKRQLALVGEGKEIALGYSNDTSVVTSMGLYEDPALKTYVSSLGTRLAAASERPALPWTFRLVDDAIVNAFAVPGGFIYITRGILAHLNSEAQLVAVLGHEIAHVTARHSVEQISRQQLAQVGMGIGMILSPQFRAAGDLAGAGLGVLFLKFGRDDETEADRLGLRYLLRTGHDPRPMPDVFTMLGRVGAKAGDRAPTWLSTHPAPENRREALLKQIAELDQHLDGRIVAREEFLTRLAGMVFGPDPRQGFFEDNLFLHPELAFRLSFPSGWKTANQRQAVLAMSQEQDAMIEVTIEARGTMDAAASAFFKGRTMPDAPRRTTVSGIPAIVGEFVAQSGQTPVAAVAMFVEHAGRVFRLLGYSILQTWPDRGPEIDRTLRTFARLTDPAVLGVQPQRLEIVKLQTSMTFMQFIAQWPSDIPREEVALINQVELYTQLPAGAWMKRIVRGQVRQ